MALYPSLPQSYESTRSVLSHIKTDIAADGTVRAQNFYSNTVYSFSIKHPLLTDVEKNNLEMFYELNSRLNFTFEYAVDKANYTLIFQGEPQFDKVAFNYWNVTVNAIGAKI